VFQTKLVSPILINESVSKLGFQTYRVKLKVHWVIKSLLLTIKQDFSSFNKFLFYTDVSLNSLGSSDMTMGIGWIQTLHPVTLHEFKARILHWSSSPRAELVSLISVLLTLSPQCQAEIYTDSQLLIHGFNRLNSVSIKLATRRLLKLKNHDLWSLVNYFITIRHISIVLHKVKAHSGITYNDKADQLA